MLPIPRPHHPLVPVLRCPGLVCAAGTGGLLGRPHRQEATPTSMVRHSTAGRGCAPWRALGRQVSSPWASGRLAALSPGRWATGASDLSCCVEHSSTARIWRSRPGRSLGPALTGVAIWWQGPGGTGARWDWAEVGLGRGGNRLQARLCCTERWQPCGTYNSWSGRPGGPCELPRAHKDKSPQMGALGVFGVGNSHWL